ncbi:hypothetical protein I3F58_02285 [Streptomyces sp. MUM 203J]|nr:hypothetical protein [Streptomyces sp. MUM 203J]MCH0538406.1 hypothetical protein [Streptomyces sp. MUM 203J]
MSARARRVTRLAWWGVAEALRLCLAAALAVAACGLLLGHLVAIMD